MPDDPKAGTPGEPGTGSVAAPDPSTPEGSDGEGKTVVLPTKLVEGWKNTVHEVREENKGLKEQIESLTQRFAAATAPPSQMDPLSARVAELLQRKALGDTSVEGELFSIGESVRRRSEDALNDALDEAALSGPMKKKVRDLVRTANYQMSVPQALERLRDPDKESLATEVETLRRENEQLKASPPTVSVAMRPAGARMTPENTIAGSEYRAVLQRGRADDATPEEREAAANLRKAVATGKKIPDMTR